MKRYYSFTVLLVLLLTAGLFAVVKITGTDDFSQNNEDVLLLNEFWTICRLKTRNGNM